MREPLIQAVFDWQKIKTVIDWKCLVLNHNHGVISWYKITPKMSIWPIQISPLIYENPPPNGVDLPLAKISEHDKVWGHSPQPNRQGKKIYALSSEFERYSERLGACSGFLWFGFENGLKLKSAPFCHVRAVLCASGENRYFGKPWCIRPMTKSKSCTLATVGYS